MSEAGGLVSIGCGNKSLGVLLLEKESVLSLSCKLASCLIASSRFLPFTARRILEFLLVKNSDKGLLAEAASLIAMNALILAGASGDNKIVKAADPLLGGMQKAIHEDLRRLKEMEDDIKAQYILAAIRNADLAAERGDSGSYLETIKEVLKHLQMNPVSIQEDAVYTMAFGTVLLPNCYRLCDQNKAVSVVSQAA